MKTSLILLFFTLLILSVFSQDPGGVWYNIVTVPPSPNAASLGKYGEVPVDKSTGVPNINVPLLQLIERGLDVPISLSYHAGGIRVDQESSWVGLGWSLNCGGVVTRTMRGLPDELSGGFLENSEKVPSSYVVDMELNTIGLQQQTYDRLNEMALGNLDFEPDQFYYNVGKSSGSFILGNHKMPILIPTDDVKIEPVFTSLKLTGFIIIDKDGLVYVFGDLDEPGFTETTHVNVKGPDQPEYVSSWYLKKIVNPLSKSEVNFEYQSFYYTQSVNYSTTKTYESNGSGNYDLINISENQCVTTISDAKYLSKIQFTNGVVEFYSSLADDGGRKLDQIKFQDRSFQFSYDYFVSDAGLKDRNNLRLRLLSVEETCTGAENSKKHSFEYSPIGLPPKNSTAVDHWGFFNNKNNNQTRIPKIEYAGILFGDANREPDPSYSGAAMLKKIIYPTGGRSEFTYENNTYGRFPIPEEIATYHETDHLFVTGANLNTEICTSDLLPFPQGLTCFDFHLVASVTISDPGNYDPEKHKGRVEIYSDANPNNPVYSFEVKYENPVDVTVNLDPLLYDYALKVCASGEITTTSAHLTFGKYDPDQLTIEREFPAGGLRIIQVKHIDTDSGITKYNTYEYGTEGYLNFNLPPYYMISTDRRIGGLIYQDYQRLMIYSSPVGGLGASSNNVSYEKVIEYLGTPQNNNGKIETVFDKYPDAVSGGTPPIPQVSNQWLRSRIISESYFVFNANDDYRLVKSTENTWEDEMGNTPFVNGFKVSRIMSNSTPYRDYPNEFAFTNFTIRTYGFHQKKSTIHEYFEDDLELVSFTDYFYDNPRYKNPNRIETQTSDGNVLKTILKYPLDYISCTNNCQEDYENDLETCNDGFVECSRETHECMALYGTCWNQVLQCEHDACECFWTYNKYLGLDLFMCRDNNDCWGDFSNCIDNYNYFECLEAIDCGYIPCIVAANSTYRDCENSYYSCILNQYESATNEDEKGICLMAMSNIHNTPIEKIFYLNDQKIEHYRFIFNEFSEEHIPVLMKAEKENGDEGFFTGMLYDRYDEKINLAQVTEKGTFSPETYIWGYNFTYVIAKIVNSTLDEVVQELDELGYTIDVLQDRTDDQLRSIFNNLQSAMPQAMITSYTYKPLVGMTSETDPAGNTTYYEYDDFGRLVTIKDHNGKVIKHVDYHYAEEEDNDN